jgi:hypothetical protein
LHPAMRLALRILDADECFLAIRECNLIFDLARDATAGFDGAVGPNILHLVVGFDNGYKTLGRFHATESD